MLTEFDSAIHRIPRWILLLAIAGTILALIFYGVPAAGGYLLGSLGAWVNFRLIERAASRVTSKGAAGEKTTGGTGFRIFIQFTALVLAALAILMFSGFNKYAALCGLLITPAAVILEILYELVSLRHRTPHE